MLHLALKEVWKIRNRTHRQAYVESLVPVRQEEIRQLFALSSVKTTLESKALIKYQLEAILLMT